MRRGPYRVAHKDTRFHLRLSTADRQRLDGLAVKMRRSRSAVVRLLIQEAAFNELEQNFA